MEKIGVKVKFSDEYVMDDGSLPVYQTEQSAGFDLMVAKSKTGNDRYVIAPGQTLILPTGLHVEIPDGYAIQILPRSGTSFKTTLRIANAPGLIDSDYRGEIGIICHNAASPAISQQQILIDYADDPNAITINAGDRIAQGILVPIFRAHFILVDELSNTERGAGGFGSTGK